MICNHFLVRIGDASKSDPASAIFRLVSGAEVGCARCGQTRHVWSDGTVEIVHGGGKSIDDDEAGDA